MTAPDPRLGEIEQRANNPFRTLIQGIEQVDADRDYLLAELRKRDAALARVEDLAKYLDTLAPGDKHYAQLFRAAIAAAGGGGE